MEWGVGRGKGTSVYKQGFDVYIMVCERVVWLQRPVAIDITAVCQTDYVAPMSSDDNRPRTTRALHCTTIGAR